MSAPTTEKPKSQPEAEEYEFLLESKPVWRDLLDQIKELFSPEKQPELVLESKPIPVKSIWSESKSLSSRLTALGIHLAIIGILLLPFWQPVRTQIKKVVETQIFEPAPVVQQPRMRRLSGGGSPAHVQAPKLVQVNNPHVAAPTTYMPDMNATALPSFGSVGPVSGPPGEGGGSGSGPGGTGSGDGGGNCVGANCGDGVVGSAPVAIYNPDPQYSDAARKAKFQGTCIVQVLIGADGRVSHPVVVQPLGLGLDQKAIQAVLTWRFIPAKDKNGHPIAVTANVEVNFRLF